jgi:hypothetical protein
MINNALDYNDAQLNLKTWTTFIYSGNYVHTITKLFKKTKAKIAFKAKDTVKSLLHTSVTNKYKTTRIISLHSEITKKLT